MMSAASINGVTIGYDDAGTGENVLVLVHGHPFDRSMWRMQIGRISRQDLPATLRAAPSISIHGGCRVAMQAGAKMPRLQRVIDERERFERPGWRVIAPDLSLSGWKESGICPISSEKWSLMRRWRDCWRQSSFLNIPYALIDADAKAFGAGTTPLTLA